MKNLFSKYISIVLIAALILPTTSFAQSDVEKSSAYTPEQIQLAKRKTYSVYHPEYTGGRTLEMFENDTSMATLCFLSIASSIYVVAGSYSFGTMLNQAHKKSQLTNYGLINDLDRLAKYIERYFASSGSLPLHDQENFRAVNNLIETLYQQVRMSEGAKILPFPKDPDLAKNWSRLAHIVNDLQWVNHKKYFEYFMGLRRFGYANWIEKLSKDARIFIENNRLKILSPAQENLFENHTRRFEKEISAKGKVPRRLIRGAGSLIGAYIVYELILTFMYRPQDNPDVIQALHLLPEELDEMARADWEMFAYIWDQKPELWIAGGEIHDSIPAANKALQQLDLEYEEFLKN
jgi:hypothetical protein